MAGQLGHQTVRRGFIEPPVDKLFQSWLRYRAAPVIIAVPERVDGGNLSEESLMDEIHGLDVSGIEEALLAGEEDFLRGKMLPVHVETLLHVVADGLLAIHVLTSVEGIHHNLIMSGQRRGDDHGIDTFVGQQPVIVFVSLGSRHYLQRLVERRLVDVGKGHYVSFLVTGQESQQETTSRTGAYHADATTLLSRVADIGEHRKPRTRSC